ncbi:hypothetical protein CAEBREN_15326 [Caenorhabditis brenneri]|uniref:Sdz-33 F-box domain-containing protein n=1 Tax=Caenorhabditis brenneri TaxID=135651 RepID=G0NL83_CAEBE|nr:hypothetical protein CAEBREN_15326 [Caenorhabditis brenneri]
MFSTICPTASNVLTKKYRISLKIELIEDAIMIYLRSPNGTTLSCHTANVKELEYNRMPVHSVKFHGKSVNTVFEHSLKCGSMTTFWSDPVDGVEVLINHFLNLLPQLLLSIDCASKTHLSTVIKLLEARKPNLEKVQIECNPIDKEFYKQILDVCGSATHLHLLVETLNDSTQLNLEKLLSTRHLHISHGSWVTVESLDMLLGCSKLTIHRTALTSQNLNNFLKNWKEQSNLESVHIASTEINVEEVIDGIDAIPAGSAKKRGRMMTYGYTIQQMNGTKADIVLSNNGFLELKVQEV